MSFKAYFGVWIVFTLLYAPTITARDEPRIRDLTGRELTRDMLIEILEPRTEPPAGLQRTRGARSLTPPTHCKTYQEQRSRGITVRPVADIAAVEILFDFDSSELTPVAARNLDVIGDALVSPGLDSCCFQIEGHTDSVGHESYNFELSERRAKRVVDYLAETFSIDPERLLVVGQGESHPIADNGDDAGRQKNRRVQIVNLGYGQVEE